MIFPASEKSGVIGNDMAFSLPPLSFTGGAAGDAMSGAPTQFGNVSQNKGVPTWIVIAILGMGAVIAYKRWAK